MGLEVQMDRLPIDAPRLPSCLDQGGEETKVLRSKELVAIHHVAVAFHPQELQRQEREDILNSRHGFGLRRPGATHSFLDVHIQKISEQQEKAGDSRVDHVPGEYVQHPPVRLGGRLAPARAGLSSSGRRGRRGEITSQSRCLASPGRAKKSDSVPRSRTSSLV